MYVGTEDFVLEKGTLDDFRRLERFHYRIDSPGVVFRVYRLRWNGDWRFPNPAGVIVYSMPALAVSIRSKVFANFLDGLDSSGKLDYLNTNFRTISRVIVDPRFRGLALAVKMVKESIERMDAKVIESLAVMGRVNNFFEKAGMNPVYPPDDVRVLQMQEAFSMVGIHTKDLVDAQKVNDKIKNLTPAEKKFIEDQIREFMKAYGKRRNMPADIARTRYILSKLSAKPVYYYKIKN